MTIAALARRVAKLEARHRDAGRVITIVVRDDDDAERDRQLAEIERTTGRPVIDRDLVIVVRDYAGNDPPAPIAVPLS